MKLTIYIPTYQRSELNECLASIMPQLTDGVEVIVSDNDPQSNIKSIPGVQYQRRWLNMGCDSNCLRGFTQGYGGYVWVLGDDDVLLPGAIEQTLGMLDGTDRIMHYSPVSGEVPAGYRGSVSGMVSSLADKSYIVAATLCSVNVWRRDAIDLTTGCAHLDSRNVVAWAGLQCETVSVASSPLVKVNTVNGFAFEGFEVTMTEYVDALTARHGLDPLCWADVTKWNFAQP